MWTCSLAETAGWLHTERGGREGGEGQEGGGREGGEFDTTLTNTHTHKIALSTEQNTTACSILHVSKRSKVNLH